MKKECEPTSKSMQELLPEMLRKIGEKQVMRPDLIIATWPEIVGEKLAPMAAAVSFADAVLHVKVKNATLHSLLSQYEKFRLLQSLRARFPKVEIRNIVFRIG